MEKAKSDLQGAVSKVKNSVAETHSLITEVQSRLGNIYSESSDRINSLETVLYPDLELISASK